MNGQLENKQQVNLNVDPFTPEGYNVCKNLFQYNAENSLYGGNVVLKGPQGEVEVDIFDLRMLVIIRKDTGNSCTIDSERLYQGASGIWDRSDLPRGIFKGMLLDELSLVDTSIAALFGVHITPTNDPKLYSVRFDELGNYTVAGFRQRTSI